ncbi:MAG: TPM domain-containing protein [Burkholderiaceae bacterium]
MRPARVLGRRAPIRFPKPGAAPAQCLIGLLLLLMLLMAASLRAQTAVPALQGRVNDLTATLSPQQRDALERRLAQFEQRKGSQLVILMLPSTQPEPIESFSIRVAEAWKIGRGRTAASNAGDSASAIDDGVLIVVAKADRRMRIEVGYGLEGAIPDAVARRIISDLMAPRFRENDFAGGLDAAVQALIARIDQEALPAPAQGGVDQASGRSNGSAPDDVFSELLPVILVAFFIGLVASQILGRFLGAAIGAGVGAYAGVSMTASWLWLIPAVLVLFVLILLMGGAKGRGRGMRSVGGRRGGAPWVIPGGGLGGGWGGSGGGGFSGGGGGFGGGGASGDW